MLIYEGGHAYRGEQPGDTAREAAAAPAAWYSGNRAAAYF